MVSPPEQVTKIAGGVQHVKAEYTRRMPGNACPHRAPPSCRRSGTRSYTTNTILPVCLRASCPEDELICRADRSEEQRGGEAGEEAAVTRQGSKDGNGSFFFLPSQHYHAPAIEKIPRCPADTAYGARRDSATSSPCFCRCSRAFHHHVAMFCERESAYRASPEMLFARYARLRPRHLIRLF